MPKIAEIWRLLAIISQFSGISLRYAIRLAFPEVKDFEKLDKTLRTQIKREFFRDIVIKKECDLNSCPRGSITGDISPCFSTDPRKIRRRYGEGKVEYYLRYSKSYKKRRGTGHKCYSINPQLKHLDSMLDKCDFNQLRGGWFLTAIADSVASEIVDENWELAFAIARTLPISETVAWFVSHNKGIMWKKPFHFTPDYLYQLASDAKCESDVKALHYSSGKGKIVMFSSVVGSIEKSIVAEGVAHVAAGKSDRDIILLRCNLPKSRFNLISYDMSTVSLKFLNILLGKVKVVELSNDIFKPVLDGPYERSYETNVERRRISLLLEYMLNTWDSNPDVGLIIVDSAIGLSQSTKMNKSLDGDVIVITKNKTEVNEARKFLGEESKEYKIGAAIPVEVYTSKKPLRTQAIDDLGISLLKRSETKTNARLKEVAQDILKNENLEHIINPVPIVEGNIINGVIFFRELLTVFSPGWIVDFLGRKHFDGTVIGQTMNQINSDNDLLGKDVIVYEENPESELYRLLDVKSLSKFDFYKFIFYVLEKAVLDSINSNLPRNKKSGTLKIALPVCDKRILEDMDAYIRFRSSILSGTSF